MITYLDGDEYRYEMRIASATASGDRASNEDVMGIIDLANRGVCCVLADGAGGHGHGALAARLTVQSVLAGFRETPLFAPAGLASLISLAENQVRTMQPTSVSRQYMSATVVLLCVEHSTGRALWAHWGDSRLYCFREGQVYVRTEDHSVVQQPVHAGLYQSQDDVRRLPNRSVLAGAIGAEGQVPPTVAAQALSLQAGDAFLLCSDGLWENLVESDMQQLLEDSEHPDEWVDRMLQRVLAMRLPNQDNLSAVALWVDTHDTAN